MQSPTPKRAAIYARISQKDPRVEAIADQQRRCQELADREGYTVVATFSDDGISAFSGKARPGWLALNGALTSGTFDVVLAVAEDRLARSSEEKIGFQAACARAGLVWHTASSGRVNPGEAQGGLLGTITGAVAEYESHIKRERVQASVDRRLRAGVDLNGPRPFGFERDRLTIRETEAAWVRWAVQSILDGGTLYGVRKRFNAEGVTTSTGRPWLTTTARQLLIRPRNAGLLVHKREVVSDALPALVSREHWDAMMAILEHPDRKPSRGPKVAHVGSGVVLCSVCGSAMRFHSPGNGRSPRYVCTRERQVERDGLVHPTMLESDLEQVLAEAVFMALTSARPEVVETDDAAPLRVRRAELARRRTVAQQMAELEGADIAAASRRIRELGGEIAALDEQIAALVLADSRATLAEGARSALVDLPGLGVAIMGASVFPRWLPGWKSTPTEKQQALIRDLFGPIVLDFKDVHLTKTDQRVTRERWFPETILE